MQFNLSNPLKIALLDLYEGQPNQGMRCIKEIIEDWGKAKCMEIKLTIYEVRQSQCIPSIDYDIFISSGGPGSPLSSKGSCWEEKYFNWLNELDNWNKQPDCFPKKHAFFICHSFQLLARHYGIGEVCKRNSTAFGVFPIHMLKEGLDEVVFSGLKDPFYGVDSRDYQVIEPNYEQLKRIGGAVLAIEKNRPHIPLERAIMSIRFNEYFFGTQFHPEADAIGMGMYLERTDKKKMVVETHGVEKWKSMVEQLRDPEKIMWTYQHILPNFLQHALDSLIDHPINLQKTTSSC